MGQSAKAPLGGSFYGSQTFDPLLTVGQIVTMQCLFYLSLATLLEIIVGSHEWRTYFYFGALTTETARGWLTIAAFTCAAVTGSGFLCVVIGRVLHSSTSQLNLSRF
jgi:hypothetical protein